MIREAPVVATIGLALALGLAACGGGELTPNMLGRDQQGREDIEGEKNFAVLLNQFPKGKVVPTPWAGFWWPYTENGIAWSGGGSSPAGKYDAARGGRTRAQSWEIEHHGAKVPGVQGWWGHCNGWSVAAALTPEPRESVRYGNITFTVGDLKGLLTEVAMDAEIDFYGNRVDWGTDLGTHKEDDVIPNQVFLLLTNFIGKKSYPILIDRHSGTEVWNQPLVAYEIEYPKPEDYLGTVDGNSSIHRINVSMTLYWADDGVARDVITPEFNWEPIHPFVDRTLRAELWLDGPVVFEGGRIVRSGNIVVTRDGDALIGGVWKNAGMWPQAHPDFIWVPHSIPEPDPSNPEPYANPHLSIGFIKNHILTGIVDPNDRPTDPQPAPTPGPTPDPTGTPRPQPQPTPGATARPTLPPRPTPAPLPTIRPAPVPTEAPAPPVPPPPPGEDSRP